MSNTQQGIVESSARTRKPRRPKLRDKRLYWRGPTIWCRVLDPQGSGTKVRLTTKCSDETAASATADEYERTATNPRYRSAKETTLDVAIADLQAGMILKGRAVETINTVTDRLGHARRLWGKDFPIARINGALIQEYIDTRMAEKVGRGPGGQLSRTTVGVEIMALRLLVRRAKVLGKFDMDVEDVIEHGMIGKQSNAVERWATMEQSWDLIRVMAPRPAAQLAWICATACRAEEARRVLPEHVAKVKEGVLIIDGTKTRHVREVAREIPVSPLTKPFLDYALANQERAPSMQGRRKDRRELAPAGRLFTVTQAHLWYAIQQACEKLGFGPFSANDFRRGFCHWHMDAGFSEDVCALLLRHQDTTMVRQVYGQHDRRGTAIAAKMMGEVQKHGLHVVPILYRATGAVGSSSSQLDVDSAENKLITEQAAE